MLKSCSIIIPCYKTSIEVLEQNIIDIENNWNDKSIELQIILVLDGNLSKLSKEFNKYFALKRKCNNIIILKNKNKLGQQTTVLNGFDYCSSDIAITLDDDYKYPVNDLCELTKKLYNSNYKCFIGKPVTENENKIRSLGTKIVKKVFNKIYENSQEKLYFTSFRIIKKDVYKNIVKKNYLVPVVGYLILEETDQVTNFNFSKLKERKSRYNYFELFSFFINMNLFYTGLLFKILIYSGLVLTLFSTSLMVFYLYNFLFTNTVPGFTTTALLLLIILQILLYSSAIIIKYLSHYANLLKNVKFNKLKTYEEFL